ncbi:MAG: hypothetical protein FJ319_12055 [SAR202 cluster bacterium]|nr:hypothetical protein [SAR202 cluster bacterium]
MAQAKTKTAATTARQSPPDYRIIYNWDGAPLDYSEIPFTTEKFLEKVYAIAKDTQVGAMFWCVGSEHAEWPSKKIETLWTEDGKGYDSVRSMRHAEGVKKLFEGGNNPYQAMVKRGHELGMAVYASVRMNDNHFYGTKPEEFKRLKKGSRLRRDHPEWLLSEMQVPEQRAIGSWNMAIAEVREHRLEYITEACMQADWDGVELDWQRHAFHVPENDGYRLRYTLTDLQRAVRRMTDKIAQKRGKPFYVAARVSATLESCRRIGYDIEAWAKEGLCDIIIPAGCSGTDPDVEVEKFKKLVEGTGIKVYAGLDSLGRQDAKRLISGAAWKDGWVRAVAAGDWDRGVDGMYVFNWHGNEKGWRSLLTTIGSPDTLKGKDKVYAAIHRGPIAQDEPKRNAVNDRIYGETAVALYQTFAGEGPRFQVRVHDDVAAESKAGKLKSTELHIEIEHFSSNGDKVDVWLDGKKIGEPKVRDVAAEDAGNPSDVSENKWLVWSLTPEQASKGTHVIKAVYAGRDPRMKKPMVISHVEIMVFYK